MNDDKSTSQSQVEETEASEGFEPTVKPDSAGHDTIGYGHKLTKEDKAQGTYTGKTLTKDEAEALLKEDLKKAEDCVKKHVTVPLTQDQFDALVDFVFNLGCAAFAGSTLLKKLNAGDYASVPAQLARWNKATVEGKKVVLAGLTKRRAREAARWQRGAPLLPKLVPPADNADLDRLQRKTDLLERWTKLAKENPERKERLDKLIDPILKKIEQETAALDGEAKEEKKEKGNEEDK